MDHTQEIVKIRELIEKAREILIVTHERPTHDSMGASLALFLALTSKGKKVTIACPDPMLVEFSSYIGANKLVSEVGKKNFVISLDYVEGSIEKVSYNIEGNKFNLVIEPREGFPQFDENLVSFTHAGASADCIIAVDTIHLGGLKKIYESDKDLYASKPIINVDRHPNNVGYGAVNYVLPQASSTAEVVWSVLTALEVPISEDIATNLLNAVYGATNNFTSSTVSPQAFELAATCVKVGGKRFTARKVNEELPRTEVVNSIPDATRPPQASEGKAEPAQAFREQPAVTPVAKPQPTKPGEAPADWLKPKIYKSSNLL